MIHVAPLCITISETAATTPMDIQEDENNTKKKSLVFDSGMATVFEAVRQDMDRLCLSDPERLSKQTRNPISKSVGPV